MSIFPLLCISQKELAAVLVRMGCLSSAVEVLSRLEMWEELAICYDGVGRKAKAVELLEDLLAKERTPSLLCLMGDITQVRGGGLEGGRERGGRERDPADTVVRWGAFPEWKDLLISGCVVRVYLLLVLFVGG